MREAVFLLLLLTLLVESSKSSSIHAVIVSAAPGVGPGCSYSLSMDIESARAYHALITGGVPAENIIVFMDGQIINDRNCNPYPGHLYKDPERSVDFLPLLRVDYAGKENMTKNNFLAVIQGNKDDVKGGSGRVLNSTENDYVLFYHGGHGDVGQFQWPNSKHGLTKKELHNALKVMQQKKMFKQLAYFVSTCHSGSMFENALDPNGLVYAMTGANADESELSSGCFPFPDGSDDYCTGSEFTFAWFNNTDRNDLTKETLSVQYEFMKAQIASSHACHFGNMKIASEFASIFEGTAKYVSSSTKLPNKSGFKIPKCAISRYEILKRQVEKNPNNKKLAKMLKLMKIERNDIEMLVNNIVFETVNESDRGFTPLFRHVKEKSTQVTQLDCHHRMIRKNGTSLRKSCKKSFHSRVYFNNDRFV
ncbi:hypothetical protein M3Y97_00713000 [Aphelenchoides bicaudatus]|nr:hypothetical protein M3Y97_00713000 [Aphelenchoides bicaudatus]